MRRKVGVEPSGDAFNSISLQPDTGRPLNPMINAGAIATASLVHGRRPPRPRLARVLEAYLRVAARPLAVDDAVYESERRTGHRNRAIGHMLRNFDILGDDPEPALDLYFRQCSILVDCRDLGADGGDAGERRRQSGHRRARASTPTRRAVLSVMTTCGMYD